MRAKDLAIIKQFDRGALYDDPLIIEELFTFDEMKNAYLKVSHNAKGEPTGYLPVGYFYENNTILSYIPAMCNSPPISPTYPSCAQDVIKTCVDDLDTDYFDSDIIGQHTLSKQIQTASAYCLPVDKYLQHLSTARRKDIRRKLKQAQAFSITQGTIADIKIAWQWMLNIWEQRGYIRESFNNYIERNISWLHVLEHSERVHLSIEKYLLNGQMVGVNCCGIHNYHGKFHIDDYMTWFDPDKASGLGIISAVRNLTNPHTLGFRYNLGTPELLKEQMDGHEYKYNVIPASLRLTQSQISNLPPFVEELF
jgi:phage-related protein